MVKTSRVTVIIPNYNHARFLEERIECILEQSYQDYEIMILDDCSTDNSLDIINRYKDHPKVALIVVNEQNSGSPFKQWQKGIAMAKGDIIWIAESDDSCAPDFLEKMVDVYTKSNAVLAFCKSKTIDETGNEKENHFQDRLTDSFSVNGYSFICKYLVYDPYVMNISSAIFSKKIANHILGEYTTYRGAGDWMFCIEMAREGIVAFHNSYLNYYRSHLTNTTFSEQHNGNSAKEIKRIYDYLLINDIISTKEYKRHRRNRIRQIHFTHYPKDVRKELLDNWGAKRVDLIWLKLLTIYNSILLMKKKVTGKK